MMQGGYAGLFMKTTRTKDLSRVQSEMGKLMHHDEQELLSVWEGWHWDDNKGGWLDPELCAKARREEVEYIRRHKMYTRVSRETCLRETGRCTASKQDGRRPDKVGNQGSPTYARGGSPRSTSARKTRTVRVNTATRGAENCAVGDRHGQAWRKSRGAG